MNYCPCCSNVMLRHVRKSEIYWFCPHCYQEMPDLEGLVRSSQCLHEQAVKAFDVKLVEKVLALAV